MSCTLIPISFPDVSIPKPVEPSPKPEPEVPVFRYGRSLLNGEELKAYDEMLVSFKNWKDNKDEYSDIHHRTHFALASKGIQVIPTQVHKILRYIDNDNPGFYNGNFGSAPRAVTMQGSFIDTFYTLTMAGIISRQKFDDESKKIQSKASSMLAAVSDTMTEGQKARVLHDQLLDFVTYSMKPEYRVSDIHGAFISGRVLCEGYALAYLYLLQKAGLKAFYTEVYQGSPGSWGLHAWVAVQIEGNWYYVDITGDDGPAGAGGYHHNLFLIGMDEFNKFYTFDNGKGPVSSYPLPVISQSRYPNDKSIY